VVKAEIVLVRALEIVEVVGHGEILAATTCTRREQCLRVSCEVSLPDKQCSADV
jgi:hypothetical protein